MAIFWRDKLIAAKIEATEGTDAAPAGADVIECKNVSFSPMEGQDIDRDLERAFFAGGGGTIPADLHAKIGFEVELAGSGTAGTAPNWGRLLRGCAMAETIAAGTSVTYNDITNGQESLTFHFFVGATKYALVGTRGNAKFDIAASAIPKITFEFTGMIAAPVEDSRPTPDYSGWIKPMAASTVNTPTFEIDTTGLVMRSFSVDLGNDVQPRFLVGSEAALITGKEPKIECQVEAVPVSNFDPYDLARTAAQVDVTFVHGTAAGNIVTLNAPAAQMQRPGALTENQGITEWPLTLAPQPTTGNDHLTLTLT